MSAKPRQLGDVGLGDSLRDFISALFDPPAAEFAAEFRAWLADVDAKERIRSIRDAEAEGAWDLEYELLLDWQRKLASNGWLCIAWPREYGGRDANIYEQAVYERELARLKNPQLPAIVGVNMVGPTLIRRGTDEQRQRFVTEISSGRSTWCQGFSEPDAGSDLASLTTRAEKVDGGWRLVGQKTWTSYAHVAEYGCFLARTDSTSRHHGISVFLLQMNQASIDIQSIETIDGKRKINGVFLDGAFVPDSQVLGEVNEGWRLIREMLAQERIGVARLAFALEPVLTDVLNLASENSRHQPEWRRHIVDYAELRNLYGRVLAAFALIHDQMLAMGGGAADPSTAAIGKLVATELTQDIYRFGAALNRESKSISRGASMLDRDYLTSLSKTIAGGVSEIQMNIIAERALGLPR